MVDMDMVFKAVTQMTAEEVEKLKEFIEQREKVTWWVVPPENLAKLAEITRPLQEDAAKMTEEEINAVIDEAIAEVRRERNQNQRGD
jgi:hypothetical protein